MDIRHLTSIILVTVCALPLAAQADVIKLNENPAQVVEATDAPKRGMSQAAVLKRFGEPQSRQAAVGQPPISSWDYGSYRVYFEHNLVLHTVAR